MRHPIASFMDQAYISHVSSLYQACINHAPSVYHFYLFIYPISVHYTRINTKKLFQCYLGSVPEFVQQKQITLIVCSNYLSLHSLHPQDTPPHKYCLQHHNMHSCTVCRTLPEQMQSLSSHFLILLQSWSTRHSHSSSLQFPDLQKQLRKLLTQPQSS